MFSEENINNYYKINIDILHKEFEEIENNIEGRICHSSILLLKILTNIVKIENYLEIGVHNGGSMSLLISNNNSKNLYGIDLFEDMYDINKHYNEEKYNKYQYFKKDNLNKIKTYNNLEKIKKVYKNNCNITLIKGNSYYDNTENNYKNVSINLIDLLFIDGDHTLDGVKNDFERYSKYVKKNGFIIFDDYHHNDIKNYCDNLLNNNKNFQLICKFKSIKSDAIDLLIMKL
jgi:predicted O-methyltransferase YrrM